jgi:hypothetical protein
LTLNVQVKYYRNAGDDEFRVIAVPEKKKAKSPKKDKGKDKGKDKSPEKKDSKKKTTKGGKSKKKEEKSAKYAKQVDQLLEMGFGQSVAELALEKTSGDVVRNTTAHAAHIAHAPHRPALTPFSPLSQASASALLSDPDALLELEHQAQSVAAHTVRLALLPPPPHICVLFTVTWPHRTLTRRRCSTPASRACPRCRWRASRTSSVSPAPSPFDEIVDDSN